MSSSQPVISVRPGSTKQYSFRSGEKIAGFAISAQLVLNDALPTPLLGTKWGIFGDGRKRVDWDKTSLDVVLYRDGEQITVCQNISLRDLVCFTNYGNSAYDLVRYSDNGSFPYGDTSQLQQYFTIEFATGPICLRPKDELRVQLRIDEPFATGYIATTATVNIGGSVVSYVEKQTGTTFINPLNSRIELSPIFDNTDSVEVAIPKFVSQPVEPGATSFTIPIGDNVNSARFIDFAFGRLSVDASINQNVVSLAGVQVNSEQLSYSANLPQIWANSTQQFKNWVELTSRRGDLELLGDTTAIAGSLVDFDKTSITLNLRSALVKDQFQRVVFSQYSTSYKQQALAAQLIEQKGQKLISKISK